MLSTERADRSFVSEEQEKRRERMLTFKFKKSIIGEKFIYVHQKSTNRGKKKEKDVKKIIKNYIAR